MKGWDFTNLRQVSDAHVCRWSRRVIAVGFGLFALAALDAALAPRPAPPKLTIDRIACSECPETERARSGRPADFEAFAKAAARAGFGEWQGPPVKPEDET